jgi:hypothetical protein
MILDHHRHRALRTVGQIHTGWVAPPVSQVMSIVVTPGAGAGGNGHLEPGMAVLTKRFLMGALAIRIRELFASP